MLEKNKDDLELEYLISQQRVGLLQKFQNNFKIQEQTLSIISNGRKHADSNAMGSNKVFWNAAGFVNICSYDLKVIGKELTFATDEWSKRYFARQACHLLYELTKDLFEILGKEFRNEVDKLTNNDSLKKSLTEIRAKLNEFKDTHSAYLYEVRNVSSAHRDKDILLQLKVIESISWIDTISIMTKFDNIMNQLGSVLQEIINRSSTELDRNK